MAKISIPLHASLLLFVCCLHAPFAPGQEIKPVICHEREFPPESPDRAPHSAASKAADKCIFHENFSFWNCSPDVPLEGLHWLINDELISMEERFSWPLPEGRHVVTLVLDTPFGTFSTTENFVVVDVFPIHAAFDPCPASGAAPLHVDFLNRSSDYPWLFYWWDFGDGQTSTEQNPKHLYEKPGFYTVCLEVAALRDCKGESKDARICHRLLVRDGELPDCEGNLLQDPGFEEGDLRLFWDASPLSSSQGLLCSPDRCREGAPFEGRHWLRFHGRFTDDILAFGQKLQLDPGIYLFSYWYKCSAETYGSVHFHMNEEEIDRLLLPEMHSENNYVQGQCFFMIRDREGEQASLLHMTNPTLGPGDLLLDHFCLRRLSPLFSTDQDNDGHISDKEALDAMDAWQSGNTSLTHAVRTLYLWQRGGAYHYNETQPPPLCWEPVQ